MVELIAAVIAIIIVAICFGATFYLFSQWVVHPKQRRRFQVCKPYLLIGWGLNVIGGAVIRQIGRAQNSDLLTGVGSLVACLGLGLTVYAAIRLLRANAAERHISRVAATTPASEGVWPPPPDPPAASQ